MKKYILIVAAISLVGMAGCEMPTWFSHKQHAKEDIDCETCHPTFAKEAAPGMPTVEICLTCHDEISDEQAMDNPYLAALKKEKEIEWSGVIEGTDDLIFSHADHHKKEVKCVTCHGDMTKVAATTKDSLPSMNSCLPCHDKTKVSQECSTCHKVIRKDRAPDSHKHLWTRGHGQIVRQSDDNLPAQCGYCHTDSRCISCHNETKPRDHTNQWRHIGHGIAASIERDRCATCHQSDSCDRCHEETAPRSHRGSWDAPLDRHCRSCHLPVNNVVSNCLTCHKMIEHPTAPAMPAGGGHVVGANCRACHAATLVHPDNGDACSQCH